MKIGQNTRVTCLLQKASWHWAIVTSVQRCDELIQSLRVKHYYQSSGGSGFMNDLFWHVVGILKLSNSASFRTLFLHGPPSQGDLPS